MSPGVGRRGFGRGFGARRFGGRGFGGGYRNYGAPQRSVGRFSVLDAGLLLSAVVAFVALFFAAFSFEGQSKYGWGFRGYWVAALLVIAGGVIVYLRTARPSATLALPAGARPTTALVGLIGLVFAVLRTALPPKVPVGVNAFGAITVRANVAYGGWIELGAVLVFAGLALYDLRRTGEKLPWQRGAGSSY